MTYPEKLKDPRWQKRRLEIFARDNFTCKKCGDTQTILHCHHLKYNGNPWEAPSDNLDTLCSDCHGIIETVLKLGVEYSEIEMFKMVADKKDMTIIVVKFNNSIFFLPSTNGCFTYINDTEEYKNLINFLSIKSK